MKRLLLTLGLALLATPAWAGFDVVAGDTVKLTDSGGYKKIGGVFTAEIRDAGGDLKGSFQTFCVEFTQTIALNTSYAVTKIDDENSTGKPLTEQVAWWYTEFLKGDAGAFADSSVDGRQVKAADVVQYGIWLGMDYAQSLVDNALKNTAWWGPQYLSDVNAIYTDWLGLWNATDWTDGLADIGIMQVGTNNQDQLVPLSPPAPIVAAVPEPATLAIWGMLATLGLAAQAYRRRMA